MAEYVGGDMIRGHIDTIILNSLIDGDKDTNQIRAEIEERAAGRFQLKQGTFYSALQRISKQGLVNEYRTTGADGVRRKFFQLTEKGKAHIEQTQSSWTMSRQVINNLIDAPQGKEDKNVTQPIVSEVEERLPKFDTEEKVVSSFSSLDSMADNLEVSPTDKFIFESLQEDEEEVIESEVLPDENVQEINAVFTSNDEDDYERLPSTFDDILDMVERVEEDERMQRERDAKEFKERYDSTVFGKRSEEVIAQEQAPQQNNELQYKQTENVQASVQEKFVFEPETVKLEDVQVQQQLIQAESIAIQPVQESIVNQVQPDTDTVDDYLDSDDIPSVKDYKEVLSSIFANARKQVIPEPKQETVVVYQQPVEQPTIQPTQQAYDTREIQQQTTKVEEETYDVIVDELDFTQNNKQEKRDIDDVLSDNRKTLSKKHNYSSNKKSIIDYSDILELSREEGFKVTTSDNTNKNELGKILINKLNFHSLLIYYLMIALEVLIIGFTMENLLQFGIESYVIFCGVLLILPIVTGILYYMAPRRTVSEVSSFKSSFETALIITLNVILMVLVIATITDLDFDSIQAVTRMIFIPILGAINIPLYVVIRYSLLEKQMYFS